MPSPVFSIVIIVKDFPHLFAATMDSILKQSFKEYEIIVVKRKIKKEIEEGFKDQIAHSIYTDTNSLSELMNLGLSSCSGKYIQFLYSGDYFLSLYALEEIHQIIDEHKIPDLIYCAYLKRELDMPPFAEFRELTKDILIKGVMPTRFQCCWFSTKLLNHFGGYNQKYSFRPNLNLLSQVYKDKTQKIVTVNKVLVDFEARKKSTADLLRRTKETFLVVLSNFGFINSFRWFFAQDLYGLLKGAYKNIKSAFFH
ncbi:MAG: hypothetical protein PVI40_08965 [Chlamydiota bacterium]|jgi:glycosyltransferase involved in cell wall biosynthesis